MTDDRIRQALEQALPTKPVDAEPIVDDLVRRYAHQEGPDGSSDSSGASGGAGAGSGFPLLGLIGVVAGGLAGILIALSIGNPSPVSSVTLGLDGVPVFACPGEGRAGTLHRGDRIFIIGQTDGWLAVRNVRGSGETVFVEAAYVVPDHDVSDLPHRDCEPEGILTIGEFDTTTTTEPGEETTTTTEAGVTTTTQPGTTTTTQPGATTTQPGATTTTTAPDTTPPAIGNAWVDEIEVFELPDTCPTPHSTTINAFVTDNVGVTQVRATWSINGSPFAVVLSGGPGYSATFGPFPAGTVAFAPPWYEDVIITITARDAAGNVSSEQVGPVRVRNDCGLG